MRHIITSILAIQLRELIFHKKTKRTFMNWLDNEAIKGVAIVQIILNSRNANMTKFKEGQK